MIHRDSASGPSLQVPTLNTIQVLIDRSETSFTEVGVNTWRAGLVGPPHNHTEKEQIFFITEGSGWVVVGPERYSVEAGDAVYIPPGVLHQTIAGERGPLTYVLYNGFLDDRKEGHSSFAEHVDAMGEIRAKQALAGTANIDGSADFDSSAEKGLHVRGDRQHAASAPASPVVISLLDRAETRRSEARLAVVPPGAKQLAPADESVEQTLCIISGSGCLQAAGAVTDVNAGHAVFLPSGTPFVAEAAAEELQFLWLRTYLAM